MKGRIIVIIAVCAAGIIFFISTYPSKTVRSFPNPDLPLVSPVLSAPPIDILSGNDPLLATRAWMTFQNYLEFARTHNLPGIKSLSHQISDTCNDPVKEQRCFALMDSVYIMASKLKMDEFKHIQADRRQIMMFTDGPIVAILYFTRDESLTPKMLGLRFCFEETTTPGRCVEADPKLRDQDGNGWWDNVESLFYR
ncbi:MAG: hypothetical protein Q7R69_03130 [bacterium]|nr:hypothetical protein [bacterium]